ncbi:MAG TPA: hypothetical protein DCE56_45175 [Cyanobacteria bacterium UBA8553]|nr:hypothetical protein [Cyanobacteria bacterium UBA8553]HAJ61377.1 hypothetical protein [Cyanobacteria bacterium UBA8543]
MNPADGWMRSHNRVSVALVSGKAPVYWQRELRRIQARQDFWWRDCAWLDAIASIHLSLRDEPLLGHCLLALTEQETYATEPHPESFRTQPTQLTWHSTKLDSGIALAPDTKRRKSRDAFFNVKTLRRGSFYHENVSKSSDLPSNLTITSFEEPSSQHSVAIVLQQSPQVSQQLLYRLVGETGSTRVTQSLYGSPSCVYNQATSQDWVADLPDRIREPLHQEGLSSSGQVALPFNTEAEPVKILRHLSNKNVSNTRLNQSLYQPTEELSGVASSSLLTNQALHQKWLLELCDRTRHSLNQEKFDTASTVRPRLATSDKLALNATLSLAQQWSISVQGQTAHLELLTHLVDTTVAQHHSSSRQARETSVSRQTPLTHSLDLLSTSNLEKTQHNQMLAPTLTESELVVLPTRGVSQTTNGCVELPTQIAPTVGISSLPPMLPPQRVHLPIPPVASAIIQQEVKQEETETTEDDLNVLAAKIKRILDEEARRYGIDV